MSSCVVRLELGYIEVPDLNTFNYDDDDIVQLVGIYICVNSGSMAASIFTTTKPLRAKRN